MIVGCLGGLVWLVVDMGRQVLVAQAITSGLCNRSNCTSELVQTLAQARVDSGNYSGTLQVRYCLGMDQIAVFGSGNNSGADVFRAVHGFANVPCPS